MGKLSRVCTSCGAPVNPNKIYFISTCDFCGQPLNPKTYYLSRIPIQISTYLFFSLKRVLKKFFFYVNNIAFVLFDYFVNKFKKLSKKNLIVICTSIISVIILFTYLFFSRGLRFSSEFPFILNKSQLKNRNFKKVNRDFAFFLREAKIKDVLKDYEAGIYYIDQAIKLNPYSDEALLQKGRLLYSLNRFQEVLDVVNKAIEVNPKNENLFYLKGISNSKLGNSEMAIDNLKKAISLDSSNSQTHKVIAQIYFEIKNYKEARNSYFDFISLEPNNYEGYFLLGTTLQELKNHSEAIKKFSKSIEINARNPYAYFKRAFSYWYIGKPDKSCNDYVSAQTLGIDIKNNGMYSSICN